MRFYNQGMTSNSPFMYSSYPSMYMYHQPGAMPYPYADGPTGRSPAGPGTNSSYPGMPNNTDNASYTSEISQFPQQTITHSSNSVSQSTVPTPNSPVYPGSYSSYGPPPGHTGPSDLWHSQGPTSHMQQRPAFGYSSGPLQVPGGGSASNAQGPRSGQPLPPFGPSSVMSDYHQPQSKQATQPPQQPQPSPQQQQASQQSQFQSQTSRSYCSASGAAPSSSLISSHLSTDVPPMSSYPSPQASAYSSHTQGLSASQQQAASRQASSRAGPPPPPQNVRPFSPMSYPPPGSSPIHSSMTMGATGMIPPISPLGASVGPSAPSSRYPSHQQYSGYSLGQGYGDGSSQARLSPYTMSAGPNSPGYRPSFGPAGGANLPAMSPRRPTATPPSIPPASRTPDRGTGASSSVTSGPPGGYPSPGQLTSPNNQGVSPGSKGNSSGPASGSSLHASSHSSSSHPHSAHGPLSSHGSHPPPTNSLQQLEQMVMPHLNSPAPSNKINSISSIIASSASSGSSNSYFNSISGQTPQQSQISSHSQLPPNMYPRFPSPSGASPGSGSYYPTYNQQNSPSLWQGGSNQPPSSGSTPSIYSSEKVKFVRFDILLFTIHGLQKIIITISYSHRSICTNNYYYYFILFTQTSTPNVQSPMASAATYSPAAQINEQQSSQKQDVSSPGIASVSLSKIKTLNFIKLHNTAELFSKLFETDNFLIQFFNKEKSTLHNYAH